MPLTFHWFLPTNGDSRHVVGGGHGTPVTAAGGDRPPTVRYLAQIARAAEDLGFELGMLAGSVASLAVLGAPDIIVLTLTEFAEQARRIGRAGALPLLVDADHGYGNAMNVQRTVRAFERAGAAMVQIEDQAFPKRCGHLDGKTVVPPAEMVGKRWVDGELVDNPNAEWRIDEATRDEIRSVIEKGLNDNIGHDAIADAIREAGAFSEDRAEMIANTEERTFALRRAHHHGAL